MQASSVSDDAGLKSEIAGLLANGCGAETGWDIDDASVSDAHIQTEWRHGYSCYRFGDYRRRILVRLASDETPRAIYVKTESARMDRTPKFLWWGGHKRGWIGGHDPGFQSAVKEEFNRHGATSSNEQGTRTRADWPSTSCDLLNARSP